MLSFKNREKKERKKKEKEKREEKVKREEVFVLCETAEIKVRSFASSAILAAPGSDSGVLRIGYPFNFLSTSQVEKRKKKKEKKGRKEKKRKEKKRKKKEKEKETGRCSK